MTKTGREWSTSIETIHNIWSAHNNNRSNLQYNWHEPEHCLCLPFCSSTHTSVYKCMFSWFESVMTCRPGGHASHMRPVKLKVTTLCPQAAQKGKRSQVVSPRINQDRQSCSSFPAKTRSLQNTHDIFSDLPVLRQMDTSPRAVSKAATVIEMFISPLAVREAMSINSTHSHSWIFGETSAALGSVPCQIHVRFAKVRAGWKLNQWFFYLTSNCWRRSYY